MSNKWIVSEVTVDLPPSSYKCSGKSCYAVTSVKCTSCKAIVYCSRMCQESNWNNHRDSCKKIKKSYLKVEKEAIEVRKYEEGDGIERNLFNDGVGKFWDLFDPRDYCRARFFLAIELKECGMENNNRLALELALEHLLDLVWLTHGDNLGCRNIIPSIMISLGKMQEAYDFMKWWAVTDPDGHYDWSDLELPFLDLKNEDMGESIEDFGTHLDTQSLLNLLMIKLYLKVELKAAKKNPKKEKYEEVKSQCKKLYIMITKANKYLFDQLLDSSMVTRNSMPESYSAGSKEEAYYIAINSCIAWDKFVELK